MGNKVWKDYHLSKRVGQCVLVVGGRLPPSNHHYRTE